MTQVLLAWIYGLLSHSSLWSSEIPYDLRFAGNWVLARGCSVCGLKYVCGVSSWQEPTAKAAVALDCRI